MCFKKGINTDTYLNLVKILHLTFQADKNIQDSLLKKDVNCEQIFFVKGDLYFLYVVVMILIQKVKNYSLT